MFVQLSEGKRTRGHGAALVKEQCRADIRTHSFPQATIHLQILNDGVNASSVNMFKHHIDRYPIRAR